MYRLLERKRDHLRKMQLLEQHLDKLQKAEFSLLFCDIMDGIEEEAVHTGIALEIFYSMATLFISFMNRHGIMTEISKSINMNLVFSVEYHSTWKETTEEFIQLAEMCLDKAIDNQVHETNPVVSCIHNYIETHLDGDLSLTQLSEIVHLTPSYLSRLYKQITDQNIMNYISELRLGEAKQLLIHTQMKIQEIGVRVGFESPPYFTRFFKKGTQLAPQEYRDKFSKIYSDSDRKNHKR